jgi:hypothetical protein
MALRLPLKKSNNKTSRQKEEINKLDNIAIIFFLPGN